MGVGYVKTEGGHPLAFQLSILKQPNSLISCASQVISALFLVHQIHQERQNWTESSVEGLLQRRNVPAKRNKEFFWQFPVRLHLPALVVPSKLPDQLDSSRPELCASFAKLPVPSACRQEPKLPRCPSPSRLLPSARAIRARLELLLCGKTSWWTLREFPLLGPPTPPFYSELWR